MAYSTTACLVVPIILQVAVLIAIMLRFYVRLVLIRNPAIDDYMAAFATVRNQITNHLWRRHRTNLRHFPIEVIYTALSVTYIVGVAHFDLARNESTLSREMTRSAFQVCP
jgi:hypothetical protein